MRIVKGFIVATGLLLSAGLANAQAIYATVTATVTDPNAHPLAGAQLTAALFDSVGRQVTSATSPNGSMVSTAVKPIILDATGSFSLQLLKTSTLSRPTGTQWQFTLSSPPLATQAYILTYQPAWSIQYSVAITGNIDLSSQLSALTSPIEFINLQTGQNTLTTAGPTISAGQGISVSPSGGAGNVTISEALPFTSLTTTGTSGPATITGGALNIPRYDQGGVQSLTLVYGLFNSGTATNPQLYNSLTNCQIGFNQTVASPCNFDATGSGGFPGTPFITATYQGGSEQILGGDTFGDVQLAAPNTLDLHSFNALTLSIGTATMLRGDVNATPHIGGPNIIAPAVVFASPFNAGATAHSVSLVLKNADNSETEKAFWESATGAHPFAMHGVYGSVIKNVGGTDTSICLGDGSTSTGSGTCGGGGITSLTGDVTASGSGSVAATLATVNSSPGVCGDATHVCAVTTNAKGLVTSQSPVAVTTSAPFPASFNNLFTLQGGSGTTITGQVGGCVGTFASGGSAPTWTATSLYFNYSQVTFPTCFNGAQTVIVAYQNDWGALKQRTTASPIFSSDDGTTITVQGNKPIEGPTLGGTFAAALRSGDHVTNACTIAVFRLGSAQSATVYGSKANSVYPGYTGGPSSITASTHSYLGNYNGSAGYSWVGFLYDVASATTAVSDADVDAAVLYIKNNLKSKGVACDNPINTNAGAYVLTGDSIEDAAPFAFIWQASTLGLSVDYLNLITDAYDYGVSGNTSSQSLASFPTNILPTLQLYGPSSRAAEMSAGTNDIAAGVNNTTILANYTSFCTAVHATSATCIVSTTLPRSSFIGGAMETQRIALNAAIVNSPSTYGIDIVDDRATQPIVGNPSNLGICTGDGIHPNPTCTGYLVPTRALTMHRALNPREPFWFNQAVDFTAYAGTSSTTVTKTLLNLLPNEQVCGVKIAVNTAFSGGSISAFNFNLGDSVTGTTGAYINALDATAVGGAVNLSPNYYRPSGVVNLIAATAGANSSAATAGVANVSICVVSNP